ncbi:hypothetical protein SprV_0401426600 [Sparganum proliferum]
MGPKTLNLSQKNSDFDENANKTQTNEDLTRLRLISSSDHGNHISPLSEHETTVFSRVSAVRGQCLIIQGLPESTASASKERISADLQLFQCLLNELLRPNEEVSVLKAFRLGKRSIDISEHSRPRPLKIVLSNQEQNKVAEWRDGSRDLQRPDSAAPSPNPLDRTDPDEGTIGSLNGISNGTIIKRSKSLKLTFYYTNVQSILPKLDELKIHICDLSPDVVSLTESWLSENVDDRELMLPGFQLFRRDRRDRQGGGVVTYVKHGLLVSEKTEQFACSAETIWLTIRVPGSQSLEVLTVYRPPRSDPEADARLLEELGRFALRPDVLIMGDFNAPLIDWSSLHARGPELAFDRRFLDMALSESLFTPPDYDFDEGPKIESVSFDEATVRKELMTLNESKSPGPDDIPPKLLKELAAELAKPLSMLFQASFEAGCLPADWKSARITPLHKGGSKTSANNYRPISLTSICCKLMEKIIKRELMRFLEQHNLLSDAQHGFRSGRSCVTNLLNCLERWTRSVDEGNALHVVYIDFKKAFDSVPHQRLLHKLSRIGVRGNLLKWIQSFLLDRCQTVHVGGQQSTEVAVESGVPQGSVLGPTLFIIYVNDCVSELDCGVGMFADDIKLWSVIRTADDEEHLQANLNRLQQWSKDWLLPFNEKKCNILRVGKARSPNHMAYCLNGMPLQEVDSQKDLGVWITTSLKPSLHCTKIAKSAMSVLYLVKRTFSAFDEDCFAKVFRTFVRPQLEFAIQAWRPWTAKDISILERVQRRATKLVAGQGSLPYATRLANLDLFPLSYRQLRGDLIQAFRIIRGQDCTLVPGDFFELATTTNLRGHQFKLRVTGARLDTRKFFFSNRVIEAWNALPVDVVMSASVEVFKRKLDLCSRVH